MTARFTDLKAKLDIFTREYGKAYQEPLVWQDKKEPKPRSQRGLFSYLPRSGLFAVNTEEIFIGTRRAFDQLRDGVLGL